MLTYPNPQEQKHDYWPWKESIHISRVYFIFFVYKMLSPVPGQIVPQAA